MFPGFAAVFVVFSLEAELTLLASVPDGPPDSRASWVPCVGEAEPLLFPTRPGKLTLCRLQSEITFRKSGESGAWQPLPPTVGSTTGTQVCTNCLPQTWTDHFINIDK